MAVKVNLMQWRQYNRHPNGPKSSTIRHVLLALSTWGSTDGGDMFPSIETLAVATALNRETVRRALHAAVIGQSVIRSERDRHGPFNGIRYSYHAAVPDGWLDNNSLDIAWQNDPAFVSERQKRRNPKQGRVPTQSRDTIKPDVPAYSDSVPVVSDQRHDSESITSLSIVDGVPYQNSTTSSGISSGTSSLTSSMTSSGVRERKKTKNQSFDSILNKIEKVALLSKTFDPSNTKEISRLTGCTERQVIVGIKQLTDRGRLPINRARPYEA